jgi:peptidoglycan/xylan/chitin deacetylase (PgdA/CDA1 family)
MIRRGLERSWRAARWPRSRSEEKALVLCYHGVTEQCSDPRLCVTPSHFAEHLEVLRQHARPIRLQQLPRALSDGKLPDRSVVVTFDDGYVDNLYNAKPLLERYGIPATVFVITGYIGDEREFWWDELDRLFLRPGALPERLSLNVNGSTYRWELDEAVDYSEEAFRRHRRWRPGKEVRSSFHTLHDFLWKLLRPMTESERQEVLRELRGWAGAEEAVRPSHRPLSLEEVVALGQGGLIEVGAHTVTHPALRKLPEAAQRDEIFGSKAQLEAILNGPVTSFSYPFGNLSEQTVGIVREAGYSCACSTQADVVRLSTERFQLPRVEVQDCNGEEFARQLSRWFSD